MDFELFFDGFTVWGQISLLRASKLQLLYYCFQVTNIAPMSLTIVTIDTSILGIDMSIQRVEMAIQGQETALMPEAKNTQRQTWISRG